MKSFAELETIKKRPTFTDIEAVLRNHAETGLTIDGQAVIGIINRAGLDEQEKSALSTLALIGTLEQFMRGKRVAATEYRKVFVALA